MSAALIRRLFLKPYFAPCVDLCGKQFVVTGVSPGSIGFAIAAVLARWGADVIGTTRQGGDPDRQLLKAAGPGIGARQIRVLPMDLSNPASVDAFTRRVNEYTGNSLDGLINCAGIHLDLMSRWTSPQLTDDGFEIQWRTNYLGTLQLTQGLFPALLRTAEKTGDARIINVVSQLHTRGSNPELFTGADPYNSWTAYGLSKLALVHFSFEMQRRYGERGIKSYCLHPGSVNTPVGVKGMATSPVVQMLVKLFSPLQSLFMLSPEEGAQTVLRCASDADLPAGKYYRDGEEAEPSEHALDTEVAARLWAEGTDWLNNLPDFTEVEPEQTEQTEHPKQAEPLDKA